MRKEILIKGASSREEAMDELNEKFIEWRKKNNVKSWRWVIAPEALQSDGKYRAYARLETL